MKVPVLAYTRRAPQFVRAHPSRYKRTGRPLGRPSMERHIQGALDRLRASGKDEFTSYDVGRNLEGEDMSPRELVLRMRMHQVELGIRKTGREVSVAGDMMVTWTWREPSGTFRRPPSHAGSLGAVVDDVVAGRRAGYVWTSRWKFDIDDAPSMERTYDALLGRTLYAVGTSNLTLVEREKEMGPLRISANEGVSLWRRADGTVFMDNTVVLFAPKVSEAWVLKYAKEQNQQVIIKVDGRTRSWEFIDVPGWKVHVKGAGVGRTFEPMEI